MNAFKKLGLILKLTFLSVFGTSRGLANIEEEIKFITGEKDLSDPVVQKPTEKLSS